jgi:hypothetical protein
MKRGEEEDPLVIVISDNEECNQIDKEQVSPKTNKEDDLIELCTVQRVPKKSTTYYNDDELKDRCQVYKRWNIKLKANPNENLSLSNHKLRLKKTSFDALTTKNRHYKFSFFQEENAPQQSQPRNQTNSSYIEIDALKSIHPSNRNMSFSLLPKQEIENLKKEDLIYDSYYATSAYFKKKHHVQSRPTPTFSSNSKEKKRYHTSNQSNNISSMSKRQRYH